MNQFEGFMYQRHELRKRAFFWRGTEFAADEGMTAFPSARGSGGSLIFQLPLAGRLGYVRA
jgi:hypothetical protein